MTARDPASVPDPRGLRLPSTKAEHTVSVSGSIYVDDVFDQVAALSPEERESALIERCGGNKSVEAEVRALLQALDSGPAPPVEPPRLNPGVRIGQYRLEQRLGAGATASVWKAFDTHLHSFTALKLLHPDGRIRGSMALEAVMREARAASGIISDHVVRIKTAGRFDPGPHFVEMELCAEYRPGPDGAEVLEIGRTLAEAELESIDEAARVVAEAARGVDAAHRAGVLHRDLKPGNILLTPVSRRAKVTDFGLAADQIFPEPTPETPATATVTVMLEAKDGRVVGTPAYMAPEQALGHPPTRTGDVYALGATLYALIARRPPYETRNQHAIAAFDVLEQVRAGPPEPVERVVRVPRRLARIIAKAMARRPRDRYPTAADLAEDLEQWRASRLTSVDGWAPLLRIGLFARRNRQVVTSVAVLVAVLIGFGAAVGWLEVQRRELRAEIRDAEVALEEAKAAAQIAAEVRDRTFREKERALAEKRAAEEAKELALSGRSDAEARAAQEIAKRQEAEAIRDAAVAAQSAAELARGKAEVERDSAVAGQQRAEAHAALAEQSEQEALDRARAEAEARVAAQQAAADLERSMERAEQKLAALQSDLADQQAARAEAEEEVRRLTERLQELEAAAGVVAEDPAQTQGYEAEGGAQ
jgi:serine/threonine protein kinase